jgi:hypothetical protein
MDRRPGTNERPDAGGPPPLFAVLAPGAASPSPEDAAPETANDPRLETLVEKYLAKARRGGDDARYYTRERLGQLIERTRRAVEARDYETLRPLRFRELNPFSREVFTILTGVELPRLQKEALAVITDFVGAEAVAAYEAGKESERAEREFASLRERLGRRQVRFEGAVVTTREFIDTVISRGYTSLREVKRGAAPEYRLAHESGVAFVLRRRDERDYAAMRLAQLGAASPAQEGRNETMVECANCGQETDSADGFCSDHCRNRHRGDRCEGDCQFCEDDAVDAR